MSLPSRRESHGRRPSACGPRSPTAPRGSAGGNRPRAGPAGGPPPRAGLHWDVILRFTGEPVARLVYISRDPATLARDLRRLSVNYRVAAVKAFDLYPQTAHVATVVALEAA